MRCLACDRNLTDIESVTKGIFSGEYTQLCEDCSLDPDDCFLDSEIVDEDEEQVEM